MRIVKSNKTVKATSKTGKDIPIKFSKDIKPSAQDQALSHIKAAIDILGKSGMKDDVTKDSIANLGVVMFDLKSKK